MLQLPSASSILQRNGIMFGECRTRKFLQQPLENYMVLLLRYLSRGFTKGHITLVMVGNVPSSYKNATSPRY